MIMCCMEYIHIRIGTSTHIGTSLDRPVLWPSARRLSWTWSLWFHGTSWALLKPLDSRVLGGWLLSCTLPFLIPMYAASWIWNSTCLIELAAKGDDDVPCPTDEDMRELETAFAEDFPCLVSCTCICRGLLLFALSDCGPQIAAYPCSYSH